MSCFHLSVLCYKKLDPKLLTLELPPVYYLTSDSLYLMLLILHSELKTQVTLGSRK